MRRRESEKSTLVDRFLRVDGRAAAKTRMHWPSPSPPLSHFTLSLALTTGDVRSRRGREHGVFQAPQAREKEANKETKNSTVSSLLQLARRRRRPSLSLQTKIKSKIQTPPPERTSPRPPGSPSSPPPTPVAQLLSHQTQMQAPSQSPTRPGSPAAATRACACRAGASTTRPTARRATR